MIKVRKALIEDAAAIAAVHVKTWRGAYPGTFPTTFLSRLDPLTWTQRRRDRMAASDGRTETLVAVTPDGEVAGFAEMGPLRSRDQPPVFDPDIGEVYAIYVDPDHWSAGAGLALMDAAVGWLTDRGRTEIRLWVLDDNLRARRFYERYGFVLDGASDTFVVDRDGPDATSVPAVSYTLHVTTDRHG